VYINTNEDVPEGMGIVRWWGVSDCVLFVCVANTCIDEWLSLSYMASTRSQLPCRHGIFSLERASLLKFSSAGITISKRRNQLDGDIVEALQCLKALPQNFSSQVVPNVLEEETLMDSTDLQPANQEGSASEIVEGAEEWTWEEVIAEEGLAGSDNAGDNEDFEMVM
jgi:hypothetical protein